MKPTDHKKLSQTPIAIIGMGCLFPKSSGIKEYQRLLFQGEDAITEVPKTHWSREDFFDEDPKKPDYVYCTRGGFISPFSFDPTEFGIPPSSLEATDTSQLLGLVVAKKALEDAFSEKNEPFNRNRTSVILGVTGTQELVIPLGARLGHPIWRRALEESGINPQKTDEVIQKISDSYVTWQENSFPGLLGNVVAGRISNRLDLGGTNCVVDAACASSMSAIHLAIMELICGRCDTVITGGVDMLNDIFMHMCFSKTLVLSPTGDARPFSKNADGTVLGEGIGLFVLRRLDDAQRDGNRIYAVIKGVGSSSDGKSQSIYAPRAEGQANALRTAYDESGINPSTVELIEAHGTGTRVGDEVEFRALTGLFGESSSASRWCALGSVKSMIGHTKAAAGAAGLMKAVLSVYHKILPPTLKIDEPDPKLNIQQSPFYLNTRTRPWFSKKTHPRRAGISAFGFGGSNFHVVIEEYKKQKQEISWDGSKEIVAFSASNQHRLIENVKQFKAVIDSKTTWNEISNKAAKTRNNFSTSEPYRLLMVLEASEDVVVLFDRAVQALDEIKPSKVHWQFENMFYGGPEPSGKMALIFPGQGSQYLHMGRDVVSFFPDAMSVLEHANEIFQGAGVLTDYIYPLPAQNEKKRHLQQENLKKTDIAQPAIGALSMAMMKTLQIFGIKPDAVCGHSFGELTALCAAGWIDLDTFLSLSITRGRLMAAVGGNDDQNNGGMLAVKAPLNELETLIKDTQADVVLANRNSPNQGVLSGSAEAILQAEKRCAENGFRTVRLPVSAAFHSKLVKDAQKPFSLALKNIDISPTDIPVFSNTTGEPYPFDPEKAKTLLERHLLSPVNFVGEIKNLFNMGVRTFVEVGPKSVLTGLVKSILEGQNFQAVSLDGFLGKRSGITDLAKTLSFLASIGHAVDLKAWEQPEQDTRKQQMSIPLSGVNYRNQGPRVRDQRSAIENQNSEDKKQVIKTEKTKQNTPSEQPVLRSEHTEMRSKNTENSTNIMKTKPPKNNIMLDALHILQDGLKAMQALQKQTAETHQKFLETQTQATKTLQNMMENTQRLVEGSYGIHTDSNTSRIPVEPIKKTALDTQKSPTGIPDGTDDPKTSDVQAILQNLSENFKDSSGFDARPTEALSHGIHTKPAAKDPASSKNDQKLIEDNLISTVSRLTGYPVEMLALDMDIEADLGIDSIKRVEILSVLEEKMPGLPTVSPEIMGSLKTLGQILEYLSDTSDGDAPVPSESIEVESTVNRHQDIEHSMVETVSQLTGYPVEMLALDMDIEADLGIDSIKRVEILSVLEEKMPGLPTVSPEIMGSLKTLRQIVEYLAETPKTETFDPDTSSLSFASAVEPAMVPLESSLQEASDFSSEFLAANIGRKVVSIVEKPFVQHRRLALPEAGIVYVTDDNTGLSQAIVDQLKSRNILAEILSQDISSYRADNASFLNNICGLIIVAEHEPKNHRFLKDAFSLAKHLGPNLLDAARKGGALFATITRLDGAFGFKGLGIDHPIQGGLAGLVKTAALEWKNIRCRAIDIAPDWYDHPDIAATIVSELLYPDPLGPVEIGFDPNSRWTLELESRPYPKGDIRLDSKDVVIISGGARGVTAAAACALAKHIRPTLVLLGRSPQPTPEPEWLSGIEDPAAVKKAILDNELSNDTVTPVQLEKIYKKYMTNREIARNLETIRNFGADVHYHSVDVRDGDAVNTIFNKVRNAFGPIKGIIHGAGMLADCRIVDKSIEQFETVFNTKVEGLNVLLDASKTDPLNYLVLFSSVTGRAGNNGQADYAMANEVLNKIAQKESLLRPNCRVVAINWGPWDGGMVCSALKRKFESSGVDLIPMDEGAMCMIHEMKGRGNLPVEVVIGANISHEKRKDIAEPSESVHTPAISYMKKDNLFLTVQRNIDVNRYPILGAHILNGKPVVPFALITEWLGHGALHENPGLLLHGLDDMRIFHGIKLDEKTKHIRLLAGKARKKGDAFEVDVEIRDGFKDNIEVIHSGAKAILTDRFDPPPVFDVSAYIGTNGYSKTIDEIYESILFHGVELQGIQEIIGYSSKSITARISSAPSPSKWMAEPLRSQWIADPLVLDSACQMAILWCFEERGMVSLPSYSASYRQYRDAFPSDGVTAVLEIKEATNHKIKGDFTFIDSDGIVVARMIGYEAIMDESLSRAFKPEHAA